MFIPIRTDRAPRREPLITQSLIVANLLVYLCGLAGAAFGWFDTGRLADLGAFDPREFRAWQIVTSMFVHDPRSVYHLLFNMLFLWVFGAPVEDRLGRIGYAAFYVWGGVVAALAHAMVSGAPVIGASGAIAAVTGAFLALFPRSRIMVVFLIGFFVLSVPSLWLIGLYVALDVLRQAGELLGAHGSNVAYVAHIAGYVYGFSLAVVLLATNVIRREEFDVFFLLKQARRRAAFRAASRGGPSGLFESATADTGARLANPSGAAAAPEQQETARLRTEINRLLAAHDAAGAAALYQQLLQQSPDAVFHEPRQLELANHLFAEHHAAHAAAAYELLLDRYPTCSKASEVRLMLGVIYARHLHRPDRAREVIEAATPMLQEPGQAALARQLLAELAS